MLDPDLTISQVLESHPQAAHTFISLGTDCVGCYLMAFCSLREVANEYGLRLEALLEALSSPVGPPSQ